ncbi:metalloprotease [Rivularia sp. UHCC 0363]|uniref:metalloprotease n=1 Tax=Rivularia sp. UHCC 0363 TaxID=3110244 RepID=UPI002B1FEBAD|nr:site-2 protease family protein [Rivularia sp. UHCC 0363]MEA5598487.1 site-2 protease family protein [Rivularia sp. UHCC 0363]
MTLQYPIYQIQAVENIPSYLQKLFLIPIEELKEFGFQPCCYLQVKPMIRIYPNIAWEILLYNKAFNSYAKVGIRHQIEPVHLFDVEFYTFFADKTFLVTTNGKGDTVIGRIPHFILQDCYTAQTSLQWQLHKGRLRQLKTNKIPHTLSASAFIEALQVYLINYIDSLVKLKHILAITNKNLFHLNAKVALKLTYKIIQEKQKSTNIIKQRREQAKKDTKLLTEIPVELEVEGFRRMEQLQRGFINSKLRPWLLLGSFALFVVTSSRYFGTQTLIIFISALIFHEAGHLLVMKLNGYRDASLVFIPFLGAVATARKDDATITQKFCVSLAGPLPGLILGLGLAIMFPDASYSWVKQTSWILIGLNLFNLLPIYPLDGGQIADILLFSRFPYSDVLFKGFGVIIIGMFGVVHPALFLIVIPLGFNIVHSYRAATINSKLQRHIGKNLPNRQNILHYLFKYLQQFDYQKLPFNSRYLLIKNLMGRYRCFYSKRITRVILASVYCGSLLIGILGIQTVVPNTIVKTSADYVHINREMDE